MDRLCLFFCGVCFHVSQRHKQSESLGVGGFWVCVYDLRAHHIQRVIHKRVLGRKLIFSLHRIFGFPERKSRRCGTEMSLAWFLARPETGSSSRDVLL